MRILMLLILTSTQLAISDRVFAQHDTQNNFNETSCELLYSNLLDEDSKQNIAEIIYFRPDAFKICESDDDCIVVKDACSSDVTVNKQLEDCYALAVEIYAPDFNCVRNEQHKSTKRLKCLDRLCSISDE